MLFLGGVGYKMSKFTENTSPVDDTCYAIIKALRELELDEDFIRKNINDIFKVCFMNGEDSVNIRLDERDNLVISCNKKDTIIKYYEINPKQPFVIKDVEKKRFHKHMKSFIKNTDEDFLFLHNRLDEYRIGKMHELLLQLNMTTHTLYDCNVRTFRYFDKKYKRLTFTLEDINLGFSKIEFCFDHMVDGFTYVIREDKYNEYKNEIMIRVILEETEFGKNTRQDITGNMYHKDKPEEKKKKPTRRGGKKHKKKA